MSYIFLRLVNFAFRFICTQIYELFLHIHHKFPIIFSIPIIFLITTPKKLLENGESYQIHEFGTNRKRSTTASVFAVVLLFFVQFIFIFAYRKEYVFIPLYVFTRSTVALPVGNAAIGMLTYMRVV